MRDMKQKKVQQQFSLVNANVNCVYPKSMLHRRGPSWVCNTKNSVENVGHIICISNFNIVIKLLFLLLCNLILQQFNTI